MPEPRDLSRELSAAEESELLTRWRQSQDLEARNRLIESYLPLVSSIARRFLWHGQSNDDLVGAGTLGLMRALDKFDPAREVRFSTYAQYWIRALVGQQASRARSVVGGLRSRERSMRPDRSLDAPRRDGSVPLEELPDPSVATDDAVATLQIRERLTACVEDALDDLTARERFIVERRLMAEADRRLTLAQIGAIFGTSREWVRRLEVGAKAKLRRRLAPLAA